VLTIAMTGIRTPRFPALLDACTHQKGLTVCDTMNNIEILLHFPASLHHALWLHASCTSTVYNNQMKIR